ncbi:hypothetical protein GC175_28140 [bacterium]|nr:hypothetical protein [bacterium]
MSESTHSRLLQYLPSIFQERVDAERPSFLDGFLLPFDQVLAALEALLVELDVKFSPAMTPADDFLPWLASWVALVLDEEWDLDRRRRLLSEAVELYRWRGTGRGIKRYLEIYSGIKAQHIVIHEAQQPAGMQIGISSRIGVARVAEPTTPAHQIETVIHDDYVVDTLWPTDLFAAVNPAQIGLVAGSSMQLRYAAPTVQRIDVDDQGVGVWYQAPDKPDELRHAVHAKPGGAPTPNIDRLNQQIEYRTRQQAEVDGSQQVVQGGTFLIDLIDAAYCFVVEIRGTLDELDRFVSQQVTGTGEAQKEERRVRERARLQSILDLEKPAHTRCFLKFTPIPEQETRRCMQIEVHSTVGLDTAIG